MYGIPTLNFFCRVWTLIGGTSQVTRSRQPDHVCDRSPDSEKLRPETGVFRARDGRDIAKIGHLTLDQEIDGSNPSSPANTTRVAVQSIPTTTSGGFVREERGAGSEKEPRNATKFT
jgi:hypothetical protein